jgi:hypothetical protein
VSDRPVTHWLCIIRPPRPTFMQDMTEDERAVMSAHFEYLEGLLEEGKLVLAGPSLDYPFRGSLLRGRDSA